MSIHYCDSVHKPYAAAIDAYIASIRNPHKKAYAEDWADYLFGGALPPDEDGYGDLGYMARQAVRMNIDSIVRGDR